MTTVDYWFEDVEITGQRVIVANFRLYETRTLHLPYELFGRLLRTKTQREFTECISKTATEPFEKEILHQSDTSLAILSKNERGRTDFMIKISFEDCVVLEVYRLGPMRRSTGETFRMRNFVGSPSEITFVYDHVDQEDRYPSYSFRSISARAEPEGSQFCFSCVDRRGYFALHVDPIRSFEEAFALYEKSFLVKFLSLFG